MPADTGPLTQANVDLAISVHGMIVRDPVTDRVGVLRPGRPVPDGWLKIVRFDETTTESDGLE